MPICLRRVLAAVAIRQLALAWLAACIWYSVYAHARACMIPRLLPFPTATSSEEEEANHGQIFKSRDQRVRI